MVIDYHVVFPLSLLPKGRETSYDNTVTGNPRRGRSFLEWYCKARIATNQAIVLAISGTACSTQPQVIQSITDLFWGQDDIEVPLDSLPGAKTRRRSLS